MPDHLSEEQIRRYRKRENPPEELLRVDDHISQCAQCRELLSSASELRAALQSGETLSLLGQLRQSDSAQFEPADKGAHLNEMSRAVHNGAPQSKHLSYEQLETYVDGKMPRTDRDVAEAHLESCRSCSEDVRDLNTFRVELEGSREPRRIRWWARTASPGLAPRRAVFALVMAVVIVLVVAVGRRKLSPAPVIPDTGVANSGGAQPSLTGGSNSSGAPMLLGLADLRPADRIAVVQAAGQERIKSPDVLAGLQGPPQTLLGKSAEGPRFKVLQPIGEVVLDARPVFRWQPLKGADSYSVTVFDAKLNPVQTSATLRVTQWITARALKRGQLYLWQVTAKLSTGESVSSPTPPNPEARFLVLGQEKAGEFLQFRTVHPEAHLTLGILYAQAGVLGEAKKELEQLPQGDPNYDLAQKLLNSIQEIRKPHP